MWLLSLHKIIRRKGELLTPQIGRWTGSAALVLYCRSENKSGWKVKGAERCVSGSLFAVVNSYTKWNHLIGIFQVWCVTEAVEWQTALIIVLIFLRLWLTSALCVSSHPEGAWFYGEGAGRAETHSAQATRRWWFHIQWLFLLHP